MKRLRHASSSLMMSLCFELASTTRIQEMMLLLLLVYHANWEELLIVLNLAMIIYYVALLYCFQLV